MTLADEVRVAARRTAASARRWDRTSRSSGTRCRRSGRSFTGSSTTRSELVAHQHPRAVLQRSCSPRDGHRHAVAAAGVHARRTRRPRLRIVACCAAHRRVVRENPVAAFAADRARRGRERDGRRRARCRRRAAASSWRCRRSGPVLPCAAWRRLRRVRAGIAQAAEAQDLRADQQQVAVDQLDRAGR